MAYNQNNLTKKDILLIEKHLKFYQSLDKGQRIPTTAEQKHFVYVCRGTTKPITDHEIAYSKYIGIYPKKKKKSYLKKENKFKSGDINYKPQYKIEYFCTVCFWSMTVSTHIKDKQKIQAICKNCNTYRWFTKNRTVSKTAGVFETKCWNCGSKVTNATCKRDGWHGLICINCGESLKDYKK